MKALYLLLAIVFVTACSNNADEYRKPDSAIDAGREFIQNSLHGKFTLANKYMLQDEENQYWLAKWMKEFNAISEQEKAAYARASINIAEVDDVKPDSVTVISFSNSYRKIPQHLKVVKYKGDWMVDFKYTFSGNF